MGKGNKTTAGTLHRIERQVNHLSSAKGSHGRGRRKNRNRPNPPVINLQSLTLNEKNVAILEDKSNNRVLVLPETITINSGEGSRRITIHSRMSTVDRLLLYATLGIGTASLLVGIFNRNAAEEAAEKFAGKGTEVVAVDSSGTKLPGVVEMSAGFTVKNIGSSRDIVVTPGARILDDRTGLAVGTAEYPVENAIVIDSVDRMKLEITTPPYKVSEGDHSPTFLFMADSILMNYDIYARDIPNSTIRLGGSSMATDIEISFYNRGEEPGKHTPAGTIRINCHGTDKDGEFPGHDGEKYNIAGIKKIRITNPDSEYYLYTIDASKITNAKQFQDELRRAQEKIRSLSRIRTRLLPGDEIPLPGDGGGGAFLLYRSNDGNAGWQAREALSYAMSRGTGRA